MHVRTLATSAVALAAILGTASAALAGCPGGVMLPTDITMTPPAAEIPEKYKAFYGTWDCGAWGDNLPHTLIVTSVTDNGDVNTIYGYGAYGPWRTEPGFMHYEGSIADGVLRLHGTGNRTISYRLSEDGAKLHGSYQWPGSSVYPVTLSKSE